MMEKNRSVRRTATLPVRILRSAALVYVGWVGVMAVGQRSYIYYPSRAAEPYLLQRAEAVGFRPWRGEEDRLIGWRTGAEEAADAAVLILHGNAGFALHREVFAEALALSGPGTARAVFVLEYPGYGAREGRPSEASFTAAAREAFREVRREIRGPVFLLGESLGGGPACALAAAFPDEVAGLLLLTPFPSLAAVARHHYPILPARRFLRDRFDNTAALEHYRGPVAIVVADQDRVVPAALGRRLYEGYAGPKQLREDAGETHNELWISGSAPWWIETWAFLESHDADRPPTP